jgi:hypothetical protein
MFFKNLSNFNYTFKDLGVQPIRAINIFRRSRLSLSDKKYRDSYYYYSYKAGDMPEIIAQNAYNNPHYYWAILMFNEIVNPFYELPRSESITTSIEQQRYLNTGSFFYENDDELGFNSADGYTRSRFPRVGDIMVKLDGNAPASTLVSVQIIGLDTTLQRIDFLTTTENGLFVEGDSFAIIDKTGEDTYEIAYRSKILKRFDDKTKAYASFKNPKGETVSSLSEAPNKITATAADYSFYNSQLGNEKIKYTILGEFVGCSGGGDAELSKAEGYRAMNIEETAIMEADNISRIKIPEMGLLKPLLHSMSEVLNKSPLNDSILVKYNTRIK